jgi:hypothetical protein
MCVTCGLFNKMLRDKSPRDSGTLSEQMNNLWDLQCECSVQCHVTVDGAGAVGLLLQASVVVEKLFRMSSGVPRIFFRVGVCSTNAVEDRGRRERGSVGGSPPGQGFWRQL